LTLSLINNTYRSSQLRKTPKAITTNRNLLALAEVIILAKRYNVRTS